MGKKIFIAVLMVVLGFGVYAIAYAHHEGYPTDSDTVKSFVTGTDSIDNSYYVYAWDNDLNREWAFKVSHKVFANTHKGSVAIYKKLYMNAELFDVQLAMDDGSYISCSNYMRLRDAVTINRR